MVSVSRLRNGRSKIPPSTGTAPTLSLSLSDVDPPKSNLTDLDPSERARIDMANTAFRRYAELQYSLSHTRCCKLRLSYRGEGSVNTHTLTDMHMYRHTQSDVASHPAFYCLLILSTSQHSSSCFICRHLLSNCTCRPLQAITLLLMSFLFLNFLTNPSHCSDRIFCRRVTPK